MCVGVVWVWSVCEQGVIRDFEVEGGKNKTSVTRTFWLKKGQIFQYLIPC